MNNVEIEINPGKFEVNEGSIQNAIQEVLQKLQEINKVTSKQEVEISVAIVSRKEIKELNRKYRNKNEETDVLSFCYENTNEKLEGEIVLCLDVVIENAKADKIKTEEELKKNIIHSILHIVGYKHGDEMFELQENLVSSK